MRGCEGARVRTVLVALLGLATVGVAAQEIVPAQTPAPDSLIVAAERSARYFPFVGRTPPPRTCAVVKPEQIVFPSTTGDPKSFNLLSGEFTAGSISFGWDKTYEQAKMPLTPKHAYEIGNGLQLELTRLDPRGERVVRTYKPLSNGSFATWPRFSTPGRWMIIATAGANWGCFVIDRPVKTAVPSPESRVPSP